MKTANDSASVAAPDLRKYLSVQQYLEDLYRYRKRTEDPFSYQTWAEELGLKNRSYMRLIISGRRRLSEEIVDVLCGSLKFSERDQEYFRHLVAYSQSRSQEQRQQHAKRLMLLLKRDLAQTEIKNYHDFLFSPLLPRLRTLLSFDDLACTPQVLSDLLGVDKKEVEAGLAKLEELGLAERKESAQETWCATSKSVDIKDRLGDLALQMFHSESLKTAIEAIQLPIETRRYKSLFLAINEAEFGEFLDDFQIFLEAQVAKFEAKEFSGRRLYQMNFNLVPTSKKPLEV